MPYKDRERQLEYMKIYNKRYRLNNAKIFKLKVLKILGSKCACCNIKQWWNLTVDHIKPTGKRPKITDYYKQLTNGKHETKNLQILCYGCNLSKGQYTHCNLRH